MTLDQLGISQRRLQSLTAELEEIRGNYESVSRGIDSMRLTSKEIDYNVCSKSLVYPPDKQRYDGQVYYISIT